MLDDFRRIAETATPQAIQSRLVTPDEARAVISSFNRLTDPLRTNFLALPVDNIIEFSMMQTKKRPSLYNYMNGVTESTPPPTVPDAPQPIPETERDHLDTPDTPLPEPVVETEKPKLKKKPKLVEAPPPIEVPRSDEKFFRHLTERLEALVSHTPSIVVETKHAEKLLEVEQAMLDTMTLLTERVEQISIHADDTRAGLTETLAMHREMIVKIGESQAQIATVQAKLIESQARIVETIDLLTDKIALFAQTPPVVNPVVNVPAPIVNVTMQGKRTKVVERDEHNLITRIVEDYEES